MQEVLEHVVKTPVQALYSAASKDFGQARQILETMQVNGGMDLVKNLKVNKIRAQMG